MPYVLSLCLRMTADHWCRLDHSGLCDCRQDLWHQAGQSGVQSRLSGSGNTRADILTGTGT